jgi:uncharacterized protein (DUF433 family)
VGTAWAARSGSWRPFDVRSRNRTSCEVAYEVPPLSWSSVSNVSLREVRALYSVSETVRILRPSMTPRKVHYWLHTGLLGEPVRREVRGQPTLLTFDQLIKVAVLQRLRNDLDFSLQRVRAGLTWLLNVLVDEDWADLHFYRTGTGEIGVRDHRGNAYAIGGQGVLVETVPEALTEFVQSIRQQWESGVVRIRDFDLIVSDVDVMGGAPVIDGTRIETTFVAHVAREADLDGLALLFEHVPRAALIQALDFEGIAA